MGARCGIQKPIEIKNLFASGVEQTSRREEVMDQWIVQVLGCDPGNTKCSGRVLRREVKGKCYRYQCQEASDAAEYGFSKRSIKEDIKEACTVVVFKQAAEGSRQYNYWTWTWLEGTNILYAVDQKNTIQKSFQDWDDDKVTRAVVSVTWDAEGTVCLP